MLLEEFLKPLGLTQVGAARELGMSVNRLNELVLGKRGVTADTALRLARCFNTTSQVRMHVQADWDFTWLSEMALPRSQGRRLPGAARHGPRTARLLRSHQRARSQ